MRRGDPTQGSSCFGLGASRSQRIRTQRQLLLIFERHDVAIRPCHRRNSIDDVVIARFNMRHVESLRSCWALLAFLQGCAIHSYIVDIIPLLVRLQANSEKFGRLWQPLYLLASSHVECLLVGLGWQARFGGVIDITELSSRAKFKAVHIREEDRDALQAVLV